MIRPAEPSDTPALVALGDATGLFAPGEAEGLLGGVLAELHAGRLGPGHAARIWVDEVDGTQTGWTYFGPTEKADGVWDLWWIGVAPGRQGQGIGGALLADFEDHARAAGGRVLVVETSTQPALDPTRRFYAGRGYAERGVVPDFYAEGDGKVICSKTLAPELK